MRSRPEHKSLNHGAFGVHDTGFSRRAVKLPTTPIPVTAMAALPGQAKDIGVELERTDIDDLDDLLREWGAA